MQPQPQVPRPQAPRPEAPPNIADLLSRAITGQYGAAAPGVALEVLFDRLEAGR